MIGERIYSAVIEAARGSTERARIDVATLNVLRRSQLPVPHPFAYGFLLATRGDDGDEVDCFVITDRPLQPGDTFEGQVAGMMEQFEGEEADHKVLIVEPGASLSLDAELNNKLADFIRGIFRGFAKPAAPGVLRDAQAAFEFIESNTRR